jgi:hypothetical protein
MGKSYRKPVVTAGYGSRLGKRSSVYWRRVRRSQGNALRGYQYPGNSLDSVCDTEIDNPELPNPKTIVNDWDYIDYRWYIKPGDDEYEKNKRK